MTARVGGQVEAEEGRPAKAGLHTELVSAWDAYAW